MKKTVLFIFVLFFLALPAYALEISGGANYQDLDFSGKVQSEGTRIDLKNDLGIKADEPVGFNLRLDAKRHHFCFDYASIKAEGAKVLSQSIDFQGQTYLITTYVESKLEYDLFEAQYNYDLIDLKWANWGISLGPLFKVSVYDASVNLSGGGFNESYAETLPLPTLGLVGELEATKYLSFLAQANGIGYSGNTYIEYKALLRLKPFKYFNFDIGYKGMQVDYSDDNDLLDLEVKGLLLQGNFVYKF